MSGPVVVIVGPRVRLLGRTQIDCAAAEKFLCDRRLPGRSLCPETSRRKE